MTDCDLQHHSADTMASGVGCLRRISQSLAMMYARIVVGLPYWSRIG
ncbi:hypothetical protein [Nitrobacter hamburgensis]|nr:hypothetical protein [Nitrobacter hamburgensis]